MIFMWNKDHKELQHHRFWQTQPLEAEWFPPPQSQCGLRTSFLIRCKLAAWKLRRVRTYNMISNLVNHGKPKWPNEMLQVQFIVGKWTLALSHASSMQNLSLVGSWWMCATIMVKQNCDNFFRFSSIAQSFAAQRMLVASYLSKGTAALPHLKLLS